MIHEKLLAFPSKLCREGVDPAASRISCGTDSFELHWPPALRFGSKSGDPSSLLFSCFLFVSNVEG